LRKTLRLKKNNTNQEQGSRLRGNFLVIRFSSLGDVAMTVPVLQRLVKTYPQLKITVLTKPFFAPLFEGIPNVSVFSADVKKEYKGFFGLWELANELQKNDFDAVADLHNVLRTKILRFFFFFFGMKSKKIDKGRAEKKKLTKLATKKIHPLKTTHQRYADVFSALGFPIDLKEDLQGFENLAGKKLSEKTLQLVGNSTKKWIGIAPFAAYASKAYPMDLMEETIASLDQSQKYQLLVFGGGKKEKQVAKNLASKYSNLVSVVGKLSFEEELHLISNLDLMLSMDSANGHLAAMYGVPVVTLWGVTHPFAGFAPFGQLPENQLLPDLTQYPLLPTSVFGNKKVEGYEEVMRSISPKKVLQRIEESI
jgi:ADP-heptose:LPS heptosyltransferase